MSDTIQCGVRKTFAQNIKKGKIKVIVADDEPVIIMNLVEMLEEQNFDVLESATDGFEAIEACRKHHPDVILLDIEMPMLDGLTAAKCIYEEKFADTVILVTAYAEESFVDKANEIGVAGFLVKPINKRALAPFINVAMARSMELRNMRVEVENAKKSMEARKTIEKAKGHIMSRKNLSEAEAFNYIRSISKSRNMSMHDVAKLLLLEGR
jgi:response regulator NasT